MNSLKKWKQVLSLVVLAVFLSACPKAVTPIVTTSEAFQCQFETCAPGEYSALNPCYEDCELVNTDYYVTCIENNVVVLAASYECAVETYGGLSSNE